LCYRASIVSVGDKAAGFAEEGDVVLFAEGECGEVLLAEDDEVGLTVETEGTEIFAEEVADDEVGLTVETEGTKVFVGEAADVVTADRAATADANQV